MKSWPLTSSRLKSPSSSPAYGARLDRNRIQTDVSTRTIMQLRDRVLKPAHVAGESRVRVARIRGARAAARTRHGEPAPRDRDELYRYLSWPRRLTWRFATAARRYEASSSYIRLCHRCKAVVAVHPVARAESALESRSIMGEVVTLYGAPRPRSSVGRSIGDYLSAGDSSKLKILRARRDPSTFFGDAPRSYAR
jgi:hypothetical protein